tara:strand:+ start:1258 stop:1596 length:339 start_codon:yes stop_codon:yes gene_type:complete
MSWQNILKDDKSPSNSILDKLQPKEKKKLKKLLQSSQPTEYMGQELTKMTDLIKEMKSLEFIKSDKKMQKKFEDFDEMNLEIVSSAAELRKDYETLYRQLRGMVYPKKKGDL